MEHLTGIIYNIQRMSTEDGPGLRSTIFLKGCPLRCLWCSNPESQSFLPQLLVFENLCSGCGRCAAVCPHMAVTAKNGRYNRDVNLCRDCGACASVCPAGARVMSGAEMRVEEAMRVVRKDELFYRNSGGGVTFGGGEPVCGGEFFFALLEACRNEGYHVCVDTCGCCPAEQFSRVPALADLILFDCKHMDPEAHRRLTGRGNRLILDNLREALNSGVPLRVRMPLVPGANDSEENIIALAALLRDFGRDEVDVLPYHAFGSGKYGALRRELPPFQSYGPGKLEETLAGFARHGLKAVLPSEAFGA
ncbi:MAG: glycyl-radical enzyme activating protein [Desulfovibrio sp.]|jgi:pyruvate formate lyase activating enzyme|nr:glycyl-radical enzyme activating protein [Desulfovibrio sp.]